MSSNSISNTTAKLLKALEDVVVLLQSQGHSPLLLEDCELQDSADRPGQPGCESCILLREAEEAIDDATGSLLALEG